MPWGGFEETPLNRDLRVLRGKKTPLGRLQRNAPDDVGEYWLRPNGHMSVRSLPIDAGSAQLPGCEDAPLDGTGVHVFLMLSRQMSLEEDEYAYEEEHKTRPAAEAEDRTGSDN